MSANEDRAARGVVCEDANPQVSTPPLGARLREKRSASGMSLRDLARRLDLSASLVSQIETGKVQPSVRTLYAIVSELGLSLDEILELDRDVTSDGPTVGLGPGAEVGVGFVGAPRRGAALARRADERGVIELDTGVRWELMAAWNDPDVEFMIAVYGVGGSSSADGKMLRHSGREFGLVLSGTLGVTVGFEDHVLEAGDSITFQSTTPHQLRNDGLVDARAIWVTLGRHDAASRGQYAAP